MLFGHIYLCLSKYSRKGTAWDLPNDFFSDDLEKTTLTYGKVPLNNKLLAPLEEVSIELEGSYPCLK